MTPQVRRRERRILFHLVAAAEAGIAALAIAAHAWACAIFAGAAAAAAVLGLLWERRHHG